VTLRCIKCHRKLTRESASGYGPVCAKKAAPTADLFTSDVDRAKGRMSLFINGLALEMSLSVKAGYLAALGRRG
jgi:hypothetical protein